MIAVRSSEADSTTSLLTLIVPVVLIAAVTILLGMLIFGYFERYAKRTGKLKRRG